MNTTLNFLIDVINNILVDVNIIIIRANFAVTNTFVYNIFPICIPPLYKTINRTENSIFNNTKRTAYKMPKSGTKIANHAVIPINAINSYMYSGIQGFKGIDHDTITSLYAEYGYYMTLINIPLTLASTAPTSMIPEVSAQYAKRDMDSARDKIDRATWISMFISIPCAVGLAVLAGPITRLLFPRTEGAAAQLMMLGVITIILNGNSNISNGVLQGIGKPNIPMINAAIALVVDVIAMAILLFATDLGVYAIVVAMIIYAVVMCLLNERAMKQYMQYKNPFLTFSR